MDSTPEGRDGQDKPTATSPSLPGYHCERLLGIGGSASVWLMRNEQGEPCALKVIEPRHGNDPGVDSARREELLLTRFTHEHLLKVHEVLTTTRGTALRMDYAAGGSLLNLVSVRGPLPPGEVVTVLTPMAQVLAYLHDGGAVHGDVSPGNILFTELGKPLLADLGIGRLLGEGSHVASGTPGFLQGAADPDRLNTEADIYALAAVGWFALTGRVPGPAVHRPPLSLLVPDTPGGLSDLINWGLDGDPQSRPTAHEFARAVQRTIPAEPIDLVAAVHPAVLPNLRTRRSEPAESMGRGRRRRATAHRSTPRRRATAPDSAAPNRAVRSWGNSHPVRWTVGITALALALITLVVLAMTGPPGEGHRPLEAGGADTVEFSAGPQEPVDEPTVWPSATQSVETPSGALPAEALPTEALPTEELPTEALAGRDPLAVLPHLSEVRARAFETADPGLLQFVNVPRSSAMTSDNEAVTELAARGHVLAGLRIDLSDLALVEVPQPDTATPPDAAAPPDATAPPDTAAVSATATTSGYSEISASGRVHRADPEPVSQQLVFVLQLVSDRWLILQVYES